MIKLKNGYGIVSDGKSYTLVKDVIKRNKDGVEKEIKEQISFHSTLESALQGYKNCVMTDVVYYHSDYEPRDIINIMDELKEEIKAYE